MGKGKITMKGFHLKPGVTKFTKPTEKYEERDLFFDVRNDDDVSGMGQPITAQAASAMISDYHSKIVQDLNSIRDDEKRKEFVENTTIAVIFGKETLLRLLSQENCEGIRFYSCLNDENKPSLVLSGVDVNGCDLSAKTPEFNKNYVFQIDFIEEQHKMSNVELDEKGGPKGKYTLLEHLEASNFDKELSASSVRFSKELIKNFVASGLNI